MTMRRMAWGALLCAMAGLATEACGSDAEETGSGSNGGGAGTTTGSETGAGAGATAGAGAGSGVGGMGATPVFESDIVPIFEQSCGANTGSCHARDAYAAIFDSDCRGWLSLENAAIGSTFYTGDEAGQPTGCPDIPLYERLMMMAWQCGAPGSPGEAMRAYVVPCEPEASYLLHKMRGTPMCEDPGGVGFDAMPPDKPADPQDVAVIAAWIAAGAPRLDGTVTDCGGGGGSPIGSAPVPLITHPGNGDVRPANVIVPFIGEASDAEDGQLAGAALVWSSDLDGMLGTGLDFDAQLSVGMHTITLEVTDSDGNVATDTIQLTMNP